MEDRLDLGESSVGERSSGMPDGREDDAASRAALAKVEELDLGLRACLEEAEEERRPRA